MRVNVDHWNVLLDFAEKHPAIITQKFQGVHGRQNHIELWDELSNKLNSLGYGEKTIKEWKKGIKIIQRNKYKACSYQTKNQIYFHSFQTLIDWKSKVKAKASGIRSYENQTGGGPPCDEKLSSVENRLLCLMEKSSYEGNPGYIEVGLKKRRLSVSTVFESIYPAEQSADYTFYLVCRPYNNYSFLTDNSHLSNKVLIGVCHWVLTL